MLKGIIAFALTRRAITLLGLIVFIGAGLFAVLAWMYRRGMNWRNVPLVVLLVIAALLTKTTAVVLVAALFIGVVLHVWRSWRTGRIVLALAALSYVLFAVGLLAWQHASPQQFSQVVNSVGVYFRIDVAGTLRNILNPDRPNSYLRSAITVF
jgi:4-amino-4-deoxy-L-arabinose transferase-like glycosyltransferase